MLVPPLFSNIEMQWEHEFGRRVLDWLGRNCRVTTFDKRGMGLSDRSDDPPTIEERVMDMLAVLDVAGVESTSLVGLSEGGIICQLFASSHPERVNKLVLANSSPGATITAKLQSEEEMEEKMLFFIGVFAEWGENARPLLERFAPDHIENEGFVRWMERYQRQSASANDVTRHAIDVLGFDAWDELPDLTAPTLVANCRGDRVVPAESGDLLAERIPNAERLLFEGGDHFYWFGKDWLEVAAPLVSFIAGHPVDEPTERRFATVVFTDIVGSTSATAARGDTEWRELLDQHDRLAWNICDRIGGTIVKSTGDGLLAYFEMPDHAVDFAVSFRMALADLEISIRAGLHVGQIEIRENGDVTGIAVNIAARVEQAATDGGIFVSSTVRDMMMGGPIEFEDRGSHRLKGIDDDWRLYEVVAT